LGEGAKQYSRTNKTSIKHVASILPLKVGGLLAASGVHKGLGAESESLSRSGI